MISLALLLQNMLIGSEKTTETIPLKMMLVILVAKMSLSVGREHVVSKKYAALLVITNQ